MSPLSPFSTLLPDTACSQPRACQHKDSRQVQAPEKLTLRCKRSFVILVLSPPFQSMSVLRLPFCSPLPCCCFPSTPSLPQLNPSHSPSRQALLHKAASGKTETELCCISSVQVGIVPCAFCLHVQSRACAVFHCKQPEAVKHKCTTNLEASCRKVVGR